MTWLTVNIRHKRDIIGKLADNELFRFGTVNGTFLEGLNYLQKQFGLAVSQWSCRSTNTKTPSRYAWKVTLPKNAQYNGQKNIDATIIVKIPYA